MLCKLEVMFYVLYCDIKIVGEPPAIDEPLTKLPQSTNAIRLSGRSMASRSPTSFKEP